jgi:hypothetical protein
VRDLGACKRAGGHRPSARRGRERERDHPRDRKTA